MNLIKLFNFFLLVLVSFHIYAIDDNPQRELLDDTDSRPVISSVPVIKLDNSGRIENALNDYKNDLEDFLLSRNKDYKVSYGVADINALEGSSRYILALSSAYNSALVDSYKELAEELYFDDISNKVNDKLSGGEGDQSAVMQDCRNKIVEREKADKAMSVASGALQTIAAFTGTEVSSPLDDLTEDIIECSKVLEGWDRNQSKTGATAAVFKGTRVMQTVIKKRSGSEDYDQIGVVIGYSPEISEVAAILASQNPAPVPIRSAKNEIRTWVEDQIAKQTGSKLGLLGTRMKRLSNGEWAIIGFSIASTASRVNSRVAKLGARVELARFANTSVAFSEENPSVDKNTKNLQKEINTTSGEESKLGYNESILTQQYELLSNMESDITLRGASNVFAKIVRDDVLGLDFHLSAHAWSPSMLALAEDFVERQEQQYKVGTEKTGSEKMNKSSSNISSGGIRSAPVLSEDW